MMKQNSQYPKKLPIDIYLHKIAKNLENHFIERGICSLKGDFVW